MADFSVGQFATSGTGDIQGQAFTPNVPGPNGSGSPGGASQAFLRTISIGFNSSDTSGRAEKIYVYAVALTDPSQIGQSDFLVASSDDYEDESGKFGPGSYSRTFNFNAGALNPALKYYAYFDTDQIACKKTGNPYAGGNAYDDALEILDDTSLQFKISMYTS